MAKRDSWHVAEGRCPLYYNSLISYCEMLHVASSCSSTPQGGAFITWGPVQQNVIALCFPCSASISSVCASHLWGFCVSIMESIHCNSLRVKVLPGIGLIKMQPSPVHRRSLAHPNLVLCSLKLDPLDTHPLTHTPTNAYDKFTVL